MAILILGTFYSQYVLFSPLYTGRVLILGVYFTKAFITEIFPYLSQEKYLSTLVVHYSSRLRGNIN